MTCQAGTCAHASRTAPLFSFLRQPVTGMGSDWETQPPACAMVCRRPSVCTTCVRWRSARRGNPSPLSCICNCWSSSMHAQLPVHARRHAHPHGGSLTLSTPYMTPMCTCAISLINGPSVQSLAWNSGQRHQGMSLGTETHVTSDGVCKMDVSSERFLCLGKSEIQKG